MCNAAIFPVLLEKPVAFRPCLAASLAFASLLNLVLYRLPGEEPGNRHDPSTAHKFNGYGRIFRDRIRTTTAASVNRFTPPN